MVAHGIYRNGVVVLDDKLDLPDGQRVIVEIGAPDEKKLSTTQKLLELAGIFKDGPSDASRNHDHYLYGAPKRESDE